MKKTFYLVILFVSFTLFANDTTLNFSHVSASNLTLVKTISYGSGVNQVGISIPTQSEVLPFGVNGISGEGDLLFLIDNINKRVQSFNLKTTVIKPVFSLPSSTFRNISLLNSDIVLYNTKKDMVYRQSGAVAIPLIKGTVEQVRRADKTTVYPYTKFLGANRVRIVSSATDYINLTFSDVSLLSFVLVSEDSSGRFHAVIEVANRVRYLIVLNNSGELLSKTLLPNAEVFRPDNDLFIKPDGTAYYITADRAGLHLYRGGVK